MFELKSEVDVKDHLMKIKGDSRDLKRSAGGGVARKRGRVDYNLLKIAHFYNAPIHSWARPFQIPPIPIQQPFVHLSSDKFREQPLHYFPGSI